MLRETNTFSKCVFNNWVLLGHIYTNPNEQTYQTESRHCFKESRSARTDNSPIIHFIIERQTAVFCFALDF